MGGLDPRASGSSSERVLAAMPTLGASYRAALGRSARAVVSRGGPPGALPDASYRVDGVRTDRERLTDYARLLGEPATDVLPAGYVHVLGFPLATALMARDDFPLPLLGLVHTTNRVTQHRPIDAGEALTVRARAENLTPHRSGTQVDLVVEAFSGGASGVADDGAAWVGRSTYLARNVRLPGLGDVPDEPERSGFVPPAATGRWRLAADVGRRYATVSGDRNPIHTSALAAKAFGFPRAIAHGMYTAARALAAVGPARGDAFDWDASFASPVLLPGTATIRVAPRAGEDDAGSAARDPGGRAGYDVAAWNARSGKLHLAVSVSPRT